MSGTRLSFDHDSGNSLIVANLRDFGFDCLTSAEVGRERASDDEQLQFATAESRLLVTANGRDFVRLHREIIAGGGHHAGILIADQRIEFGSRLKRLRFLLAYYTQDELRDQLFFLASWPEA